MRNSSLQIPVFILLLTFGVLVSASVDHGTAGSAVASLHVSALDAPEFQIEHRPGRLSMSGVTVSAKHESGLLRMAEEQFPAPDARVTFRAGVALPADWESNSMRMLYVLAATESAVAVMNDGQIDLRGVTADADALESRLEFLRDAMPEGTTLRQDFIVVNNTAALDDLCRRNLSHAITQPIAFRESSAELRTSAFAVLDRIIEVANDCRDGNVAIVGHSDASGDESWNRQLSLARARAVADYLIHAGIPADRLQVEGLGSSRPIADNDSARGRSLNRRIEFELRQSSL